MAKRYTMSIYDMNGNRVCNLYDSSVPQDGAAYNIRIHKEISGWKELSFNLSKYIRIREYNFRCEFIKNEYLLYLTEDGKTDVYCIKAPAELHDNSKIQFTVSCSHISEELKTKNLYKYFDDLNGIGTCEELIERAIRGSGWSLVSCDTFFESDGVTEKIRSYSCEAKSGAYNMIAGICDLFDARPIFDGYKKEIEIKALSNTESWMEILYGKNMNKIKRTLDSSNLVTRLYVEGEYGDYGYVGIDDVPDNESGLPFILNFDYYKEIGTFTEAHQEIVDQYLKQYKELSDGIRNRAAEMLKFQAELNGLIGNYGYAYYPILSDGNLNFINVITGNGISDDDAKIENGDIIYIVQSDGNFEEKKYSNSDTYTGQCALKFDPTFTGTVAAHRDIAKAAEKAIESYLQKLNRNLRLGGYEEVKVEDLKTIYGTDDLSLVNDEGFNLETIAEQYRSKDIIEYAASIGDSEKTANSNIEAMCKDMKRAIELMPMIDSYANYIELESGLQEDADDDFSSAMGSMLKDGYWNDSNYTVGQEESLYRDALEISKKLSRPTVTYDVSIQNLSVIPKFDGEEFRIAQTVRIYDPELKINDYGIVSETDIYPDKPKSDSIKIKTDILDIGTKSFASILERITEMAEQVRRNRDVYRRASAISKDGTIHADILEGAIDVMKTQLLSSTSNWRTDENGNIIFTSLDGNSAMMLCGGGFMIANSKDEDGTWDWRTFGTGDGFAADLIVTGFLSADRIEAKSITVNHLASDVGEKLDLSSNQGIDLKVEKIIGKDIQIGEEPLTPEDGALWLDTSGEINVLKKWNADTMNWDEVSDISSESIGRINNLALTIDGETGEIKTIAQSISDIDGKANIAVESVQPERIWLALQGVKGFNDYVTSMELTPEEFETFVSNSTGISTISQKADLIDMTVQTNEDKTQLIFTDKAISAMSQDINLNANNDFNVVAGRINLIVGADATETNVTITENALKAIADNIDLSANDTVTISADNIDLTSNKTIQMIAGQVEQNATDIANQAQDFASTVTRIDADMESLQGQIDGSITTWFYEVAPTNENAPAVNWTSTDEKNIHLGDLYYDTVTGYCYRWQVQNNAYSWQRITDTDVTKALSDAASAQDTADAKRRVFVSTPVPPYDVGDLWVQGDGGDILRCNAQKISGQSYAAGDWVKASKYTDDTTANQALTLAGSGVTSTDVEFYLSTSKAALSGGSWQTVAPEWVDGKYMWMRVKTTLKDGTERTSDPTCIAGATGATGPQGVSITGVTEEYYLSTSKAAPTGGSWQTTQPTWSEGMYIWTRAKISYSNGNVSYTEPYCDSSWEVVNDVSIYTGAEPPEAPIPDGKLWVDTAQNPNVIRRWLGQGVSTERDYTASASGNPVETPPGTASFDSIQSVLLPVQAGSGDPSPDNVRPITGWTGATLTRCGKNLINLTFAQSGLVIVQNADGTITATNNTGGNLSGARCEFTGILPAGTYTISKNDTSGDVFLQQNSSEDYSNNITTHTFDYDGVSYLRILCSNIKDGSSVTYKIQLEVGSTATAYEPYQGNTYAADFGQTVYGGTLDWLTGVLTVEWASVQFVPTEIAAYGSAGYSRVSITDMAPTAVTEDLYSICNRFKRQYQWNQDSEYYYISDNACFVFSNRWTTLEEAKTWFADNPTIMVYKLATPTTIQLPPATVTALKGANTLHTDADSVSVAYTASGWEIVNDLSEINDVSNRLLAQQAAAQQAIDQLATAITVDSDGAHFYKPGYRAQNEVRIDQDSVDILVGGSVNSSFVAGGLILGNYMLWHPEAAGGLAFNLV